MTGPNDGPGELAGELEVLWRELHRRYGASDRRVTGVSLTGLAPDTREALADLLRESELRPPDTRVMTAKVAAALGVDENGLRQLVEARYGQAGNRAADRDAAAAARASTARHLEALAGGDAVLEGWARRQAVGVGDVLASRAADAGRVLQVVAAERDRPVPLPVVAAETFGDPHALDLDRTAGRMLAALLAERAGLQVCGARERRRLLREVGIVADELSSTVTVYRLPVAADHPYAGTLHGPEPAALTLGQLLAHPLQLDEPADVLVVENPAVLSAAALAGSGAPLVCTSGMPSVAALELVSQLVDAGCTVRAHADFDAAGLVIVSQLVAVGAEPWQMDVAAYHRAADASVCPLVTEPVAVDWAPGLAEEMRTCGRAGFEEYLLDELIAPV
ncbi:DUF2399 domain-containing protein [Nitriliruptor alkaliphilus]|uniref:DUF2399 domain-containing protein n=1 Tax=Nitriliruptor alkaliphilus TaxID=427918 RepID=UPI0006970CFC|nr:DUF2399 domain-containing protein [Nitriliruptor alkaliphilus]